MLTTLRDNAQSWIIKVLLGLLVVTFIISFGVGTFSNPKEVLVEMGSSEIMVSEYMRQYQEELERLRQRFPENAEALALQINLRQQVLDRMVNRHLLLAAAGDERLQVTEAELKDSVSRQTAFHVDGRFNFETYRQVLGQNNLSPADYEARLHDDLLLGKYQRNRIAGVIVSKAEIDQRYRIEHEQAEVEYVYVDPSRMKLPRAPTAEELQTYYDAQPGEFTQPARFKLRTFVMGLQALEQDVNVRDRAVERYYERNVEREYTTPRQVRASHILKRLSKDDPPESEAQARAELAAVLTQLRAGADFAKLAKAHSQDMTADKGGDLGFFTHDDMVPAFADAAFALTQGEVGEIVRSPFGLHLIKVTGVKEGQRKSLDEVRPVIAAKLRSQRAERKLELELERVPGRIRAEGIETVAAALGQSVSETPLFDERAMLPSLGSAGPLYAQIARHRKGDVGVWRRNPVQGHVFYQVLEREEAFVPPLADIRARVTAAVRAKQQRDQAVALAKETYQRLQDGQTVEAFVKAYGLQVQTVSFAVVDSSIDGIGVNHEFQRAAFGLAAEHPYALNIKDDKAYLLRFKRRHFPERAKEAEQKTQISQQMQSALREYVLATEIERLRAQVQIDVLAPEYLASSSGGPGRIR